MKRLDDEAERLLEEEGPESPVLLDLYERMDTMDPSTFSTRASLILTGLGFKQSYYPQEDQGHVWWMAILEEMDRTLILVSHSMDFLNGVCTNMIDMRQRQLIYYGGNYDSYAKTRYEQESTKMKAYQKQDEIVHIRNSLLQLLRKIVFTFRFADVEKLPPPVLSFDDVTFSYSGNPQDDLYRNLDLGVDMDSRTALVGLTVNRFSSHTFEDGFYSQHSSEQLDLTKSALDFVRDKYASKSQDYQYWRQQLGKYGLSGESQTALMGTLSEGQKSQNCVCFVGYCGPNMLLLDEPTNGLDIPTIDSLADYQCFHWWCCRCFSRFQMLDKIAKDIMVCENQTIKRWMEQFKVAIYYPYRIIFSSNKSLIGASMEDLTHGAALTKTISHDPT
ncbi:hypothetical protein DID88_007455 [Monilinia fructigena]|uniref:ABC transporter domain-containing protein n=1 Tax=Monilinia fructigena TaxID=38457 RepID=A0A395J8U1_9HELO|nr:hypothetical protein DID88_007455 [Monilinia fructigena]